MNAPHPHPVRLLLAWFALLVILATPAFGAYGDLLKSFDFEAVEVKRDDTRDRVYAICPSQNGIKVINSDSLEVIASIFTGSGPLRMDLSPDSSRLYVANGGTSVQGIAIIDLETLSLTGHVATLAPPRDVAAGLNGRIFTLEGDRFRSYDAATGQQVGGDLHTYSTPRLSIYSGNIELSPDNQHLFYYTFGSSPSAWAKLDITTQPPTVLQSGGWGSNGRDLAISADGQFVCFASGAPYEVKKFSAADPSQSHGTFATGAYPREVAFGPAGDRLYAVHTSGHIDVWNANTYVQLPQISCAGEARALECDRKNRVLFAGVSGSPGSLRAFFIGSESGGDDLKVRLQRAMVIEWDSKPGELYQVQWRHSMGGQDPWQDLGDPVLGNGLTMSVFDNIEDMRRKFYQVVPVTAP